VYLLGCELLIKYKRGALTHARLSISFPWHKMNPLALCNAAVFLPVLQDAYPQRLKQIHLFNVPNYIDKLLTLFRSLMKEKMRSRVSVCDLSLCILLQRRRPRFSLSIPRPFSSVSIYPSKESVGCTKLGLAFFAAVATARHPHRHQSGHH
jgi:CRAL/TRIO domain